MSTVVIVAANGQYVYAEYLRQQRQLEAERERLHAERLDERETEREAAYLSQPLDPLSRVQLEGRVAQRALARRRRLFARSANARGR